MQISYISQEYCTHISAKYKAYFRAISGISRAYLRNILEQAGAELGQAQLKLGLDLNSINLNEISFIVLVE